MDKPKLIMTKEQFSQGWTVFDGFDADGKVRTINFPMRKIAMLPDGNIVVEDVRPKDDC